MDAERYRRIQDLFWEAESLQPAEWESTLLEQTEGDAALVREVISLLQEHNPEAASKEGNEALPVELPKGTDGWNGDDPRDQNVKKRDLTSKGVTQTPRSQSPSSTSTGPIKDDSVAKLSGKQRPGKPGPSRQNSSATIAGAQRTYAAPRSDVTPVKRKSSLNKAKRGKSQRTDAAVQLGVGEQNTSMVTASRPDRFRWGWLPLWLALVIGMITPIWIAAWWTGESANQQEVRNVRRLLASSFGQAETQIQLLLEADQFHIQEALVPAAREILEELKATAADSPAQSANLKVAIAARIAALPMLDDQGVDLAIWDSELQSIVASQGLRDEIGAGPLRPSETQHLVTRLRSCLEGKSVYCTSEIIARLSSGSDGNRSGWLVPVYRSGSLLEGEAESRPIGAVMLLKTAVWDQASETLNRISSENGLDLYLVNHAGVMQSESQRARRFIGLPVEYDSDDGERVAGKFRVAEYAADATPESLLSSDSLDSVLPLTIAAANVWHTQHRVLRMEPYTGYTGQQKQGAWKWLDPFAVGLIAERRVDPRVETASKSGFASLAVPLVHTWPWATWLSLWGVLMASLVTAWQQLRVRQLESMNQPLGRYRIKSELGAGGMGVVYRAEHLDLGRDIALKVLRSDCQDEDDRQRFDREACLAATLSCPHSVSVYDFGHTEHGDAFCVMELLEGITLAEVVARSGPQPAGRVVWILQQICQSILEAHSKGLMHRDLKPQNVMLRYDAIVGDWVVVFDFGLAKPIEPDQGMFQTAESIWAGTPMYMAPERFREPSLMDPRSDIYSIGCIAYYLLAGNPPFVECSPQSMFGLIMTQLPIEIMTHRDEMIDPRLDQWVRDCMAKDKRQRASDIAELIASLQVIAERIPWTRNEARQWWMEHSAPEII
ncbi:serine/threonine-protein kinase [Neorhodopirellula lusitana]|uniref:serine/threonine-protein kinase n=1 Tax=Neorhodopirellula lusitana TaxID=445327 RepID=UPI00384FB31C